MAVNDLYTDGIAGGWRVHDAATFTGARVLEADVVIVGTGAGGGTAAEILAQAGLQVLMVEAGPLKTSRDFRAMEELQAYRELYAEAFGRATADGAIQIGQGQCVGGGTVVNTTSSFRTPPQTLEHWAGVHGVKGASAAEMAPWFARMEQRLGIAPWALAPNANNAALRDGCEKLGWEWHVISRNVRGCVDSGYCMTGCPVNAKQSMLVTTIPGALAAGATLVHRLRARRLRLEGDRVAALECEALDTDCIAPTGATVEVRARHYVLAAGAIATPGVLLRSGAPDPHGRLGARTLLQVHLATLAEMPQPVEAYYGAPQSIATDEFQWRNPPADAAACKLEANPFFPAGMGTFLMSHGPALAADMRRLPQLQSMLGLMRDGFHEDSPGGQVRLEGEAAVLDYEVSPYLWRGIRHALLRMVEAQFAAGATRARPAHLDSPWYGSWAQARAGIEALPMQPHRVRLFTVHVHGGCAMGEDPRQAVTDSLGRHHQLEGVSVLDASVFPTSIGANPQLSIYGMAAKNAAALAAALKPA
jgi:choline dehydrogenase-like flavoprotein